jgi:hypothetical protein
MALPEVITDNGPIDRNFRALDPRVTTLEGRRFGTRYATPLLSAPSSTAVTADRVYFSAVQVLSPATLTGVQFFSLSATSTARCALYDSTGARVANRTTDSSTLSIALIQCAFSATYDAAPGLYYAAVVFAGTPNINAALNAHGGFVAGPGSGATATSITPPTIGITAPVVTTY